MTFLTDVMKMGYSEDEIFTVLHESERDRKRRRVLAKVNETGAAHRLQQMKDLLALEKLATWRRMNGFDRIVDDEDELVLWSLFAPIHTATIRRESMV